MKPTPELMLGLLSKYQTSKKFEEEDLTKIFNRKDFIKDIKSLDSSAGENPEDGFEDFIINLKNKINGDANE